VHFFLCKSWGFVAPSSTSLRLRLGTVRTVAKRSTAINNRQERALFVPLGAGSIVELPRLGLPSKEDGKQIASAGIFIVADIIVRRLFRAMGISFPSSLAACSALFVALITMNASTAEKIYNILRPGAALLAKWLPVFFVPSLITLPLTEPLGNFLEVVKVGLVIGGGFLFTLLTTAYSVVLVRKFKKAEEMKSVNASDQKAEQPEQPKKPFSVELFSLLSLLALASGSGMLFTTDASIQKPLLSLFWLSTTLTSFVFGARLPTKFTKLVHPLVVCTTSMWAIMGVLATLSRKSFRNLLMTYTTRGSSSGMKSIAFMGAGDVLLFMLGPAVVSLAISMYERRKLMKDNLSEVATAISVSTFGGLFGTAALVRYLGIVSPFLRLSLLSRNITRYVHAPCKCQLPKYISVSLTDVLGFHFSFSPLAMAIAGILGADVPLAVCMVVVTGLIGANFGASILDAFGIRDAVARGLGIGAAAHGLGTAAFANEKDAFPFAAIAMALTATAATITVSVPVFRKALIQLALG
jgi:putative effector of murein hydrolase